MKKTYKIRFLTVGSLPMEYSTNCQEEIAPEKCDYKLAGQQQKRIKALEYILLI